ncbi:putative VHL beta domain containing protein [Lyophyllum shimeji]|uniref:VHL beta domain containing protein n=1 Tax=Lyophyllum shimeji TaxID=47721 RepID=A0A9P3PLJ6_LYOSH|nr:putative VHL beta domain containing protein [Lyophyllum shimeji]
MFPTLSPQPSAAVENPRSVYGGASSTLNFINRLDAESAKIYWIDFSGNRVLRATIAPGNAIRLETYVGHPWEVVVSRKDETRTVIYYPTFPEANAILDKALFPILTLPAIRPSDAPNLLSTQGGTSTAIEFENRLNVAVKVFWVNFFGKRALFATVPPGRSCRQLTFVGHPWAVSTETEKEPFVVFFPAPHEGTAVIDDSLLHEGNS